MLLLILAFLVGEARRLPLDGPWQCPLHPQRTWQAIRRRHRELHHLDADDSAVVVQRRELSYVDATGNPLRRLPPHLAALSQWGSRDVVVFGVELWVQAGQVEAREFQDIDGARQLTSLWNTTTTSGGRRCLTLCSYNVWHFTAPYEQRMERVRTLLRRQGCQLVMLQEMRYRWTPRAEQRWQLPAVVRGARAWHWSRAMTYVGEGGFHHDEGLAWFLSALAEGVEVVDTHTTVLSRDESDEEDAHQRILLRVSVRLTSALVVHVFVTHMSLSHRAQRRNTLEIWREMQRHNGVVFLVGDLNGTPRDAMYRFLTGAVEWDGLRADMVDVWTMLRGPDSSGYTFFAWDAHKRIDFILMRESAGSSHNTLTVHDIGRFGEASSQRMAASDHMGLRAELVVDES